MVDVLTFDDAIEDSKAFKISKSPCALLSRLICFLSLKTPRVRHLLLGNGFSIECDEAFDYPSLFERAKTSGEFTETPHLPEVFDTLKTKDFEKVIRFLEDSSKVLEIYNDTSSDAGEIKENAEDLKNILVSTIINMHPSKSDSMEFGLCRDFGVCKKFLNRFLGDENEDGEVYTLNYDLLLYWATGHDGGYIGYDGFRPKKGNRPLIWGSANEQTVHYLHGALHFFYAGSNLQKLAWKQGQALRNQVQNAISSGKFPLFVAEGTSKQKLSKIMDNDYLRDSYENFADKMKQPNAVLFIFGYSFADKDKHILDCIIEGKIPRIYVGLHEKATSTNSRRIIALAKELEGLRNDKYPSGKCPLEVKFFDTKSVEVWRQKENINSK